MSPREQTQTELAERLENNPRFSAPYGVICGMETLPKGGKVRTVTFGVSRYLDATAFIWSPNKITFKAQGPLAYKVPGTVKSVQEFFDIFLDSGND